MLRFGLEDGGFRTLEELVANLELPASGSTNRSQSASQAASSELQSEAARIPRVGVRRSSLPPQSTVTWAASELPSLLRSGENQRDVVATEAHRIAHHMRDGGATGNVGHVVQIAVRIW